MSSLKLPLTFPSAGSHSMMRFCGLITTAVNSVGVSINLTSVLFPTLVPLARSFHRLSFIYSSAFGILRSETICSILPKKGLRSS